MQPKLILFDLDNTLFDFDKSQQQAFELTMEQVGTPYSPSLFSDFQSVNSNLWKQLELGTISKQQIFEQRFEPIITNSNIDSATFTPTYVNKVFLQNLSEAHHLLENAHEICQKISEKYSMGIITNGDTTTQKKRVKDSDLRKYFDFMVISDEVGFAKPSKEIFEYALSQHGQDIKSEEALIIGDNFTADILGGKNAGLKTCWFNPNSLPTPTQDWQPDANISELTQLADIFRLD